jgi:type IV pilus assembly protein PilM
MGDSIWKKEIKLGRKAKPDASPEPKPEAEKTSFWKKEISLGRKSKEEAAPKPDEPKQSIWKKEIGRKKEPKPAAPLELKDSLLKKEISFSRKPKEERAEKQSFWKKEIGRKKEPKPAASPTPKESLLKKEISFSRKKRNREVERLAQEAAQSIAPAFTYPAGEPLGAPAVASPTELAEAAVAAMPDPEAVAPVAAAEPVAESAVVAPAEVAAVAPPPVEPAVESAVVAPAEPTVVAQAPVEPVVESAVVPPVEPTAVEQPPVEPVIESAVAPPVEPAPLAAVPDLEPAVPLAAVPDPEPAPVETAEVHAVPMLPVDDAPAAEQSVLPPFEPVPPVPPPLEPLPPTPELPATPAAAQQPAAPPPAPQPLETAPVEAWMEPEAAAPAEPWLAAPEAPPAPVPEPVAVPVPEPAAVVVHPPVPSAELPPLPEPRVPFYKKELSFSRKPKAPKEPKAERTPFYKKELSFSRKPKEPKEPKADSTPFWKKDLSLSRKPKEPKQPKAEKTPFWKKELSRPKAPSVSRSGGGHKAERFVGLKIGASQLAAARVSNNGSTELLQVAREPLEPGIVVGGELRDPEALGDALKLFFAKSKLPRKNVRLGIASNRIGVRIFDVSGIGDDKQLENAIHFRAQEALPIPLDEAVLDYHVLDESVDDEGNATKRILLVVAYRELVDRYVSACRKAGISLVGIDLEAFALLRALSAPRPEGEVSDAALVAVAIGHDRSTFAVSDGRICEFTRVLEWGGAVLSVAVARALNLAPSEVEAIKRMVSLESNEVPQGIAPDQYALAVDAVRKQVQSFARELVSSLQFYQNQPGSLGIGEIVITGGTAALVGLAEELQRLIGVRVRVGDPLARVKVSKKVAPIEPVGSLAVAIGLGIED